MTGMLSGVGESQDGVGIKYHKACIGGSGPLSSCKPEPRITVVF